MRRFEAAAPRGSTRSHSASCGTRTSRGCAGGYRRRCGRRLARPHRPDDAGGLRAGDRRPAHRRVGGVLVSDRTELGQPAGVEHRPANYETHSDAVRNKSLFVELRVELRGLEPLTPTLPVWCATSCAIAPRSCAHRSYTTVNFPSKLLFRPPQRRPETARDQTRDRAPAAFPAPAPSRTRRSAELSR